MPVAANVGDQVDAQCGRCHDATPHKVVTAEKGNAKRCECTICGALHLWRKPKGPEPGKPIRKYMSKEQQKAAAAAATYEQALAAAGDEPGTPYSIRTTFEIGEKIDHKKFGNGVVIGMISPQVIEVAFADATRRLAMSR